MQTYLLGHAEVAAVVNEYGRHELMRRMTDALRGGFVRLGRGQVENSPPRSGFTRGGEVPGVIEIMTHREPRQAGIVKVVSYSPHNLLHENGPTIAGTISKVDDDTGHLVAVADAVFLTAMRTGAASAIASELFAHPESTIIGIVGTGAQAVTQLQAVSQVLPVSTVLAFDVDGDHLRSFPQRVDFLGLDVRPCSLAEIVRNADIICTATSVPVAAGPVFVDGPTKPHLHVNSVGSDERGKTELPISLLKRSTICVDHIEQALKEGECQQLNADVINGTLAEACADPGAVLRYQEQVTVYDSTGFAFEDYVALELFCGLARELGIGRLIDIEAVSDDPLDPYSCSNASISSGRFYEVQVD